MTRTITASLALLLLCASTSLAAPVDWNYWTSNQNGFLPSGNQNLTVTYSSADYHTTILGIPTWTPTTTWADGTILSNGLTPFNNVMQIFGGTETVNTLTFSQPVIDPVIAIWSLGSVVQGSASFVFTGYNPQLIVGGPSSEYGGNPLTLSGVTVSGVEGNGSVQFLGTYTSISWTNPQFEDYYGFNVGILGVVPEPSSYLLAAFGAAGLWLARTRRHTGKTQ
jgi:hypothetical protein